MHSSTPVRVTRMDDNEPQTTTDENETPAIQDDTPSIWSYSFTPLRVGPFVPTSQGLVETLGASNTALDAFSKVFEMHLIDKIVEETNSMPHKSSRPILIPHGHQHTQRKSRLSLVYISLWDLSGTQDTPYTGVKMTISQIMALRVP